MRSTQHKPGLQGRQRGAVILLVTFSLLAFLGLMALVLDLGQMYIVKTQLQNAADAGALRGAKELNGTFDGIGTAEARAKEAAADGNGFLLVAKTRMQQGQVTVEFADHPTGTWHPASYYTGPNSAYYVRVWTEANTDVNQISTFFAGALGVWDKAAKAVAIAGRYPNPGRVMPMYMPVLRRNDDQTNGTYCNGLMFNSKNGPDYSNSNSCPPIATDPDYIPYRGPDKGTGAPWSKTWGYLRPGESSDLGGGTSKFVQVAGGKNSEIGGIYAFKMKPSAAPAWLPVGTTWTGNYGWLRELTSQQKEIQQAVCKGASVVLTTIPGCREVHTGGMSPSGFADALNSRFDTVPVNKLPQDMNYALCTPDRYVQQYAGVGTIPNSSYQQYLINSPPSPVHPHPGSPNRRVIRVFIADNYPPGLVGYSNGAACIDPLRGSSIPKEADGSAHIVGCAEFFMWTEAEGTGDALLKLEFVKRVPDNECTLGSTPETFSDIRLYR